jgi:LysM repeat protein
MADEQSIWDRIFAGVDLEKYSPSNWSGEDIWNTISPFAVSPIGKDEDVIDIYNRLSPEDKQAFHDRQKGQTLPSEVSPRNLNPRQRIVPQSTRERVDKPGTIIGSPRAARRVTPSGRPSGPPQRTATQTSPSMGLEFGDVKGLSPTNVQTTAARREAAALRNRIVEEDARKRRAAEIARLRDVGDTSITRGKSMSALRDVAAKKKAREKAAKAKVKPTLRDVGDTSITRGKSMAALRDVAAKKKAREKAAKAKVKPKVVKTEKKITTVKPKVVKTEKKITKVKPKVVKKAAKKKTTPIEADLGTGRKAHTVKSGQTLSGIAKQHGTTLKALLAANPKLKGRPNLIKVGEKIKIRGPLKKATSPYKGMTKKEWKKITTASQKQREQRSARKTGGIVKKAGGGRMKQVGLHTAEMRSGGKDLHQPQSKIKKRIHEETTYAKKGGKVGKKKQGYKARKDESIAMRVKKKRTKKQLKASRNESYGKWGKGKGKGKINRSGDALVAASYD